MAYLQHLSLVGFVTLAVLLLCSVGVVAVLWDRLGALTRSLEPDWFDQQLIYLLKSGSVAAALEFVEQVPDPQTPLYRCGLLRAQQDAESLEVALEQQVESVRRSLEHSLPYLGTVAVIAPFVGLFGTVVGIMNTFADVAKAGRAGVEVVSAGVSEALVATAVGLVVAIIAVVAFNFLRSRIDERLGRLRESAQRLIELLGCMKDGREFPADLSRPGVSTETAERFIEARKKESSTD